MPDEQDVVEAEFAEEEPVTEMVVRTPQEVDYVPKFAIEPEEAAKRFKQLQDFIAGQMVEGEDYGRIPGVEKLILLKPGAEKLCNIFAFTAHYKEVRKIEDWENGFFYYVYNCRLINKRTGQVEADCTASANSWEERYRYRTQQRQCPNCGVHAIIKSKFEGKGWYCFPKLDGCGQNFEEGYEAIESQEVGRIPNPEPYTLVNTLQKMAQKRAHVGATLSATRASGSFTQDVEDMPEVATRPARAPAPSDEGEFIIIGGEKHHPDRKIPQSWYEKIRERAKQAGMVEPHLRNHLKKHYDVERISDLKLAPAMKFRAHLEGLIAGKGEEAPPEPEEMPEEAVEEPAAEAEEEDEAKPYPVPQKLIDRANELEIPGFDLGVFVALHVPPDMPIEGKIEKLLGKFLDGLKQEGDVEILAKAFDKELGKLRKKQSG